MFLCILDIDKNIQHRTEIARSIVITEGENLRLSCAVTGNPFPKVQWKRTDNKPINWGTWKGM